MSEYSIRSQKQTLYHTLDRDYLIKQNRKLRMQLKQSNQLKQLHQQALMQMNQLYPQSKVISTLIEIATRSSSSQKITKLNQIIMQLEAKLMVLQKISNQIQQNQKQTYILLTEQFKKLKQDNIKKQDQLHKFYQKIGEVDYISGLVTKYKQIIKTTQQAMCFKKQQEQLLDALNLQQQTIKKLQQEKDKLLKINVFMKQQVQKRKDQLRNMTIILMNDFGTNAHNQMNNEKQEENMENILEELEGEGEVQGEISSKGNNNHQINQNTNNNLTNVQTQSSQKTIPFNKANILNINDSIMNNSRNLNLSKMNTSYSNNVNTTLNFIKRKLFIQNNYLYIVQRQLIRQVNQQSQLNSSFTNDSDVDCPQLSILFPDKIQKMKKIKNQNKVPYLNMKKVRQMMAKRQEKMRKQWQQQKSHINPTNKIIQLQNELDITRKQLSNQSLKYRLISDQIKNLRFRIEELQNRNQLLTQSNHKLKNNYHIIYKDYQICKSITREIQRILGQSITKENQQYIKEKLENIIENKQKQEQQEQIQLTIRDHQLTKNTLNQIFKFDLSKNALKNSIRKRNHSV